MNDGRYEPCEECGAALDPQQRYCVNCAARRANGANPASRYFAAMSKRARRAPAPAKGSRPSSNSHAAAVGFFALLPIAVAIGVMVGRGGSGNNDQALLDALSHQNAVAASGVAAPSTALADEKGAKGKQGKRASKGDGKVAAKTKYGTVHEVTGFKPSAQKTAADTKLVQDNVKQTGQNYIKAQTHLPDVIVVGGDANAAPTLPTGKGQP